MYLSLEKPAAHSDRGGKGGWRAVAIGACATAGLTLLVGCIKALTEWRGSDHFDRALPTLVVLAVGVLTSLLVGIGAVFRGGADPLTRRWAWASIACAFLSPAAFVAVLYVGTL
jgi:hypothetical protein